MIQRHLLLLAAIALLVALPPGQLATAQADAAPPAMVRDINPEVVGLGSDPSPVAVLGGQAFFSAFAPATGRELWVSDGTPAGTQLFADLLPGPTSSAPQSLIAVGGQLFFTAGDGGGGSPLGMESRELWVSDGTLAGTRSLLFFYYKLLEDATAVMAHGDELLFLVDSIAPGFTGNSL